MIGIPLTKEFLAGLKPLELMYPKPTTADFRDIGFNVPYKRSYKKNKRRKAIYKRKFGIPKEKTRPQLIKILDSMVSDFILNKVCKGKCMRCGKQHIKTDNGKWLNYGTSHYWARTYMGTRWEVDNLDGLGWLPCHSSIWEHDKNGQYRDYMMKKLGKEGFEKLEMKARATTKFSTVDIKNLIANFDKIWKIHG